MKSEAPQKKIDWRAIVRQEVQLKIKINLLLLHRGHGKLAIGPNIFMFMGMFSF